MQTAENGIIKRRGLIDIYAWSRVRREWILAALDLSEGGAAALRALYRMNGVCTAVTRPNPEGYRAPGQKTVG